MSILSYQAVIDFWFDEIDSSKWWAKDLEFDQEIEQRFGVTHRQAGHCELYNWRQTAQGRLAEIIVLDQFSRNIFRDSPQAFESDPLALCLAQEAVSLGADNALSRSQRNFLYMPYMHSESISIHDEAVKLFEKSGSDGNLDFEMRHKAIVDRFGRYPHRNAILGRESSAKELKFLQEKNSSF